MRVELSIDIPAPREAVFWTAQDPGLRPLWDSRVADYRVEGPFATGTPIAITVRLMGMRPVLSGSYVRFDAPVQTAIRLDKATSSLAMLGGGTWKFDEIPGGTRMTTRFDLKPGKWWLLPAGMTRWFVARETRQALENLKALVLKREAEGQRARPPA